jgi:hypothetical protein
MLTSCCSIQEEHLDLNVAKSEQQTLTQWHDDMCLPLLTSKCMQLEGAVDCFSQSPMCALAQYNSEAVFLSC